MVPELIDQRPDFIVIHKPPGIAVQDESIQQGVLPMIYAQTGIEHLHLVHRLDKVTSGLLLLARHKEAAATLGHLFSTRQIEKFYLALTNKKARKKQGLVAGDMHKVRDGKWILKESTASPAVSQFFSFGLGKGLRACVLKPLTGKTHQLRVMLKSLSSPILGDTLYGGVAADRTYLHAYALRFNYLGQTYTYVCPPYAGEHFQSDAFGTWLDDHRAPWSLDWPLVPQTYRVLSGSTSAS